MRGGGDKKNRRGGGSEALSLPTRWGGANKIIAMLEVGGGGHNKF